MKWILIFLFCLFCENSLAFAQWDVSDFSVLGQGCEIEKKTVDESKLTLKFSHFSADLNLNGRTGSDESDCTVSVRFKVPPRRKLSALTHRVFALANKNEKSEIELNVALSLDSNSYGLRGILPAGSSFNDLVLLYKSFDISRLYECLDEPQYVDVQLKWVLKVAALLPGARASLNLSGEDLWVDSWIATTDCELSNAFAGPNDGFRRTALL